MADFLHQIRNRSPSVRPRPSAPVALPSGGRTEDGAEFLSLPPSFPPSFLSSSPSFRRKSARENVINSGFVNANRPRPRPSVRRPSRDSRNLWAACNFCEAGRMDGRLMTIARQTKGKRRRGGKGKGGNKAGSEAERGQNYRGQGLS